MKNYLFIHGDLSWSCRREIVRIDPVPAAIITILTDCINLGPSFPSASTPDGDGEEAWPWFIENEPKL